MRSNDLHYDSRTIVLHWLTAALVIGLWSLGQTVDWFPKGDARVFARSTHIACGIALAVVLVTRIWWRSTAGRHLPPAGSGAFLDRLATVTHKVIYALLISTVLLGIANTWIRGDNVFNLFTIPSLAPDNKDLQETVEELHGLSANILLGVALFHAAAALLHHYGFKDGVLRRMLPGRTST